MKLGNLHNNCFEICTWKFPLKIFTTQTQINYCYCSVSKCIYNR